MTVSVNGEIITEEDIQQEKLALEPYYKRMKDELDQAISSDQLYNWAVENLIEKVLFQQLARKHGGEIDPEEVEAVFEEMCCQAESKDQFLAEAGVSEDRFREDIENSMKLDLLFQDISDTVPEPQEQEILEYYNSNLELFVQSAMADVDQVVITVDDNTSSDFAREEIFRLEKKLKNGSSFDEIMQKHSDASDEDSRLGWFSQGEMVEEFENVVFNMSSGQISRPFKTELGWHIVRANKVCSESTMAFEEVKEQIAEHLKMEENQLALERFIDAEKEKADIQR